MNAMRGTSACATKKLYAFIAAEWVVLVLRAALDVGQGVGMHRMRH